MFHTIYYLIRPPSVLSLFIVVTQIRGHLSRLFSSLPTTVRALHFIARRFQHLLSSSTVETRRIAVPTHAIV